jgi:hypothetical protein
MTNQNLFQEDIKRRLNSGNACYRFIQNLLSSHLLPENLKIRIYKTLNCPWFCMEWNLVSNIKGVHRLKVFENRVLRRIYGPKRDKVTGGWRKLHNEELHNLYSLPGTGCGKQTSFFPIALSSKKEVSLPHPV